MDANTPSQTKAVLIVIAVFIIGFVAGGFAINLFHRVGGYNAAAESAQATHDRHFQELKEKVNLTKDQEEKIRAIVDHTYAEYKQIGQEVDPKINAARQACRDKIRSVLTPEQLPRFEEMVREHDRERALKDQQ